MDRLWISKRMPTQVVPRRVLGKGTYGRASHVTVKDPAIRQGQSTEATEKWIRFQYDPLAKTQLSRARREQYRFLRETLNTELGSDIPVYAAVLRIPREEQDEKDRRNDGTMYYQFLAGSSTDKFQGRLSLQEVAWIMIALLVKLEDLQWKGMVHGDLNPNNLILERVTHQTRNIKNQESLPQVTLIDWGRSCGYDLDQLAHASSPPDPALLALSEDNRCSALHHFPLWEYRSPWSFLLTAKKNVPLEWRKKMTQCAQVDADLQSSTLPDREKNQAAETAILQRSDLWSLGITIIELILGSAWYQQPGFPQSELNSRMKALKLNPENLDFTPITAQLVEEFAPGSDTFKSQQLIEKSLQALPTDLDWAVAPGGTDFLWGRWVLFWRTPEDLDLLAKLIRMTVNPKNFCLSAHELLQSLREGSSPFFREAIRLHELDQKTKFEAKNIPADQFDPRDRHSRATGWKNSPFFSLLSSSEKTKKTTPPPPPPTPPPSSSESEEEESEEEVKGDDTETSRLLFLTETDQASLEVEQKLENFFTRVAPRVRSVRHLRILKWALKKTLENPESQWKPWEVGPKKWNVIKGSYFASLYLPSGVDLLPQDLKELRSSFIAFLEKNPTPTTHYVLPSTLRGRGFRLLLLIWDTGNSFSVEIEVIASLREKEGARGVQLQFVT